VTSDDDRIAYLAGDHDGELLDESERRELDDVRALLADPSMWADPSAGLEDAIVAAVAGTAAASPSVPPAAPAKRRARPRLAVWLTGAAAAVVVAVVAVAVVAGGGDGGQRPSLAAALTATELSPGAQGEATFTRTDGGWRIELDATGLPRLADGSFYEAWLRNDAGVLVPIGTFNEPDEIVLWAGVSPVDFPTITVTQEVADGDQSSSGQRVLTGAITER
jgi:hypothetical protein